MIICYHHRYINLSSIQCPHLLCSLNFKRPKVVHARVVEGVDTVLGKFLNHLQWIIRKAIFWGFKRGKHMLASESPLKIKVYS